MPKAATPPPPKWHCEFVSPPETIQVGDKLQMICEGDAIVLNKEKIGVELPKGAEYSLKVLNVLKQEERGGEYVVVSYRVGQHDLAGLKLSDGQNSVELENLKFTVQSVMDPQKPVKEPFGPFGPLQTPYPMWLWFSIGGIIVFFALTLFLIWRRWRARHRLYKKIKGEWVDPKNPKSCEGYNSPLTPYHQFTKSIRVLNREFPLMGEQKTWQVADLESYLQQINHFFRLFLARELMVPALDWSEKNILRDIRKKTPALYGQIITDLKLLLHELQEAKAGKLNAYDCLQICELSLRLAEKIVKRRGVKS